MSDLIERLQHAAHNYVQIPIALSRLLEEAAAALRAQQPQPIATAPRDGTSILTYPHYRVTSWDAEVRAFWGEMTMAEHPLVERVARELYAADEWLYPWDKNSYRQNPIWKNLVLQSVLS